MGVKITSGLVNRPQKIVIYGPEGIGKTTLASDFPTPVFIDTEGGTAHMNVCRADWGSTWEDLLNAVDEIVKNKKDLGLETLVIDTADWTEQLCVDHILKKYNVQGIEDFGYGKGYTYIGEEFSKLLKPCDKAIAAGINVVITSHAKMRKFEQPDELGAYDRWEMKLSKQVAPLVKEWSDMLLFCSILSILKAEDPLYLKILLLSSYWMKRTTLWRWNAKRLIRMMLLKRRRKLSSYIHPARREIPKA